jgi:toxin FitB
MIYLLDSNVLSELRRPKLTAQCVSAWFSRTDADDMATSAIVILELEYGAARAAYRRLPHAQLLRDWIDQQVLPAFADRILPVDHRVAARCAGLHVPRARPYSDALIAATALVHHLTLVTRNFGHFDGTGVTLFNPWDLPD